MARSNRTESKLSRAAGSTSELDVDRARLLMLVCSFASVWRAQETHGWARRFGASHRHFAGKWSRDHAWAWRIIILVLAGRMGGLRGVLAGASFCAPFACDHLASFSGRMRVSVVAW
jgi:hypothetical protein